MAKSLVWNVVRHLVAFYKHGNLCLSDLTGNVGEQPPRGPDEGP